MFLATETYENLSIYEVTSDSPGQQLQQDQGH